MYEVIVPSVFIYSFIHSFIHSLLAVTYLLCSTQFKMNKMGKAVVLPVCGRTEHEQNPTVEVDSQDSETEIGYLEKAISEEMVFKLD